MVSWKSVIKTLKKTGNNQDFYFARCVLKDHALLVKVLLLMLMSVVKHHEYGT